MSSLDLSALDLSSANIEKLSRSYAAVKKGPGFSIANCVHVHYLFFKRKDKFVGVRTAAKSEFSSYEEFLIYSVLVEDLHEEANSHFSLEQLEVVGCTTQELESIYELELGKKNEEHLPQLSEVKNSFRVLSTSELNWVFLEEDSNYHSLFWIRSESSLFKRCA